MGEGKEGAGKGMCKTEKAMGETRAEKTGEGKEGTRRQGVASSSIPGSLRAE